MPTVKGAEAVEAAVAATLDANIAGELAAVSAAWNDGVPLPAPKLVHAGELKLVREFPTILVVSVDGRETDDGAPVWGNQTHRLDVVTFLAGDNEETLDRQGKRYLVAIWEVIKKHQDLDGSLSGLAGVMTTQYGKSATYRAQSKPLMEKQVAWEVLVTTMEPV